MRLLRREIEAIFRDNRMVAVCQNIAMGAEDKLLLRHQLRKHKILVKVYPNQVGRCTRFIQELPSSPATSLLPGWLLNASDGPR